MQRQLHRDSVKRPKGRGETHWPTLFAFPKVLPDRMPGNGGVVLKVLAGELRSLTGLPPAGNHPKLWSPGTCRLVTALSLSHRNGDFLSQKEPQS